MAWKLYTTIDPNPANCVLFGGTLSLVHYSDLSDGSQDFVLYYADIERDPVDNGSYKAVMRLGGNINLPLADSNPGSGHEATEIKLATAAAGLGGAAAGSPLSLGTQLISGYSGAREVHVRVTNAVTAAGVSVELTLGKPEFVVFAA